MAIACRPKVLIADEPTSAPDVTIQVQFMDLMEEIQEETGAGLLFITHDLGVAASLCHRIAVMYAGRIVEIAQVTDLYSAPAHPYTQGLLESLPRLGGRKQRLTSIGGGLQIHSNYRTAARSTRVVRRPPSGAAARRPRR